MTLSPLWKRVAGAGASLAGMLVCAGMGLAALGLALRAARNSSNSSLPLLIIGLLFAGVFASIVAGLIRRERGE